MASSTVENYVKQIHLQMREGEELLPLGQLSTAMGVVPGTVTTMVKALADAGLVVYEPRRGVKLTTGGEKLALHVLRRHRLIELFLVKTLGLDWSEVHEEAEALEHAVSDKVVEKLDALLGFPQTDPHGDPIPSNTGELLAARCRPLGDCAHGEIAKIIRVDNRDPAFLRYAERQGLVPGASVEVTTLEAEAGSMTVCVGGGEGAEGRSVSLGTAVAGRIWVSE